MDIIIFVLLSFGAVWLMFYAYDLEDDGKIGKTGRNVIIAGMALFPCIWGLFFVGVLFAVAYLFMLLLVLGIVGLIKLFNRD